MTNAEDRIAPRHGGALQAASRRYGIPVSDWLDLSTGINPHPYPLPAPAAAADLQRLPDPEALDALLAVARAAYDLPPSAVLSAVPGTDLAIRLLPLIAPAGPIAILGPTYRAHEESWRAAGRLVTPIRDLTEVPDASAIVVLANPNNPDGRRIAAEHLESLARTLGARGGLLVVDEAFAEVAPDISLCPKLAGLPAIVLRSFGKFYGLAGLRLGFAAGAPDVVGRLATLLGDWPVSGPAIAAGHAALGDGAWQRTTRQRLAAASARLQQLLRGAGLGIAGATDLFVLAEASNAREVHEALARHGIWTRIFDVHGGWIRFGLPPDDQFHRLETALRSIRSPRSA